MRTSGITAANRGRLETLHRDGAASVTIADAAALWNLPTEQSGRLLRSMLRGGWLTRPRRGLYVPVPLEAANSGEWHEDPWVIAVKLHPAGYIGGWSACEHWGLTEQLFHEVLVFDPSRVSDPEVIVSGTTIRTRRTAIDRVFGLRSVWRRTVRVPVSDPTRTIIDLLDDPRNGGGIRHVAEVVGEYFRGEHRDDNLLLAHADRFGNRTVFKRLGYLVETIGVDAPTLVEECRMRMSRGVSLLDPDLGPRGRIVSRWNLRVNATVDR